MNTFVVYEALAVGFKEGLKVGILWLVFRSYLILQDRVHFRKIFITGVFISLLFSSAVLFLPQGPALKEQISNFISLSFVVFLIASVGALLNSTGIELFAPFKKFIKGDFFMHGLIVIASVFFFLPDYAGTFLFLNELSGLKEAVILTYASALTGFLVAGGICLVMVRYLSARFIGSFFDIPQLLLFFALVKLFGGGTQGFAEITLIPSVQRGLMKFSHDFIHQTFVFLMVPDHPLLKTTVWNFIGIFFGPNIASWESLIILLFFPLMFIYYSLFKPLPEAETDSGAERRKLRHHILSDRRRKALPIIAFVCIIFFAWFSQGGESASMLYIPKAKPVVEDKGLVMIPVNDPTMDLRDGVLHKFALSHKGHEIKLLVIRKPDNQLSVCLDACEICQPDGYGQRENHVVCLYCNTPIPISTLGKPGGCNPIPLSAVVDDRFIRIEMSEIVNKWEYVNSGKSKESVK
jgi:uncharacterized membrane protein